MTFPEVVTQEQRNALMLATLEQVLNGVEHCRPNDRSELDRAYSVIRTEAEKMLAYLIFKTGKAT